MGGEGGAAISVVRSLGSRGVKVYLLARRDEPAAHSRFAVSITSEGDGKDAVDAWASYLLSPASDHLRGSVLLAASDPGLEVLQLHRARLARRFRLALADPESQQQLLNKLSTYRLARDAGVPHPRFWEAANEEQVCEQASEYLYPLMVKPQYSHHFTRLYTGKYLLARDFDELLAACRKAWGQELAVLILEYIPGPDHLLCSYYTYFDEAGTPLVDFTKRVIRRQPPYSGLASYHVTDWIPEARDLGLRLFEHAGLRGLGNVEFKWDERDEKLKVIECNARFTAANGLVAAAGLDLAWLVYADTSGLPWSVERGWHYRSGLTLWRPGSDFLSFLALRKREGLTAGSWLRSVLRPQLFPFFSFRDPLPWAASLTRYPGRLTRFMKRALP